MSTEAVAHAHNLLVEAVAALRTAAGSAATDGELLSVVTIVEGITRRLDRVGVEAIAALDRRGTFAERGYRSSAAALADLCGWDRVEARRRVTAAEQVCARVGIDATALPPRLPTTAAAFACGAASLRHVEVIARVLGTDAAGRLTPQQWADTETHLAQQAAQYSPAQLLEWGNRLVDLLDQDGAEPDDRPTPQVNELHLRRHRDRPGGTITARFQDAAMFDAIATAIDAHARPRCADDAQRSTPSRQAEALADVCGFVLDHGELPQTAGRRPHLNVVVRFEDLQNRARAACLDLGGTLTPSGLRMLCCDAAVIPIVLGGAGQPLDVGRATRVIPEGIRRAVTARDRGCARCGKPPSWCDIHHIQEWEKGGDTAVGNCVMVCRGCHRLIHYAGWEVRLHQGIPEFLPPPWVDPEQRPRRRPPHLMTA